ncbi:MAG: flavin reductase family protein [Burkholderiales bacterium]|nr:flavin reductase family protein [Burkholderiales bacterium]
MTEFDAAALDAQTQYKLLIGSVTPRPIALVTTLGSRGPNAAPFSFFNGVGSDPAMIMFSVGDTAGHAKDTVANILEVPEFVVHIVSDAIREKMNVCAIDYPRGVNEIAEAGFTAVASKKVRPPRIAEAPIAFECRLLQMVELGHQPYHMVIGEILYFHFHEGIVDERFHVDVGKVNPIGRLAGRGGYTRITDRFEMPRLKLGGGVIEG